MKPNLPLGAPFVLVALPFAPAASASGVDPATAATLDFWFGAALLLLILWLVYAAMAVVIGHLREPDRQPLVGALLWLALAGGLAWWYGPEKSPSAVLREIERRTADGRPVAPPTPASMGQN